MKFARRRIWIVLVALMLPVIAVIAVNAVDQDLDPEARAFYLRASAPFDRDSGWAVLAGFHAPPGDDPRAFAAALRESTRNRKPGTAVRSGADPLEVRAPQELLCVPQDSDCVRAFAARPQSIQDLVSDNAVLLARYEDLLRTRRLADVVEGLDYYEAILPHFSTVLRTQQVRLSRVGADASAGRAGEAIAWLESDGAFHRVWLEEAGSLLTKMIAVRALSRDFLVAGQIARAGQPLKPSEWEALERIAAPLASRQRGVGPVLMVECALFAKVLDEMIADSRTTSRIIEASRLGTTVAAATMRRNATLNYAYPLFADWTMLDAVPSSELARAIERVEEKARAHVAFDWSWVYNPTGKGVVREQRPRLGEYVYRVRDLDALAAVIRCTIELRRSGVGREAAAAHVEKSPACVDPYEAKALGWDAARGELSFRARAPGQVPRFGGRGDRVTFAAYPA